MPKKGLIDFFQASTLPARIIKGSFTQKSYNTVSSATVRMLLPCETSLYRKSPNKYRVRTEKNVARHLVLRLHNRR
jgi:hypothetical protein